MPLNLTQSVEEKDNKRAREKGKQRAFSAKTNTEQNRGVFWEKDKRRKIQEKFLDFTWNSWFGHIFQLEGKEFLLPLCYVIYFETLFQNISSPPPRVVQVISMAWVYISGKFDNKTTWRYSKIVVKGSFNKVPLITACNKIE